MLDRPRRIGGHGGGHLGLQCRELSLQLGVPLPLPRELGVLGGVALRLGPQLLLPFHPHAGRQGPGDDVGVEGQRARPVARLPAVPLSEPVEDVEQLADDGQRLRRDHRLRAVDGCVPLPAEDVHLRVQGGADQVPQRGLEQQGREVVFVGTAQGGVGVVEPVDGEFEGPPGVEAGSARVAEGVVLGQGGLLGQLGPLGAQEREVARHPVLPRVEQCNETTP